jgi:hypothetical protein
MEVILFYLNTKPEIYPDCYDSSCIRPDDNPEILSYLWDNYVTCHKNVSNMIDLCIKKNNIRILQYILEDERFSFWNPYESDITRTAIKNLSYKSWDYIVKKNIVQLTPTLFQLLITKTSEKNYKEFWEITIGLFNAGYLQELDDLLKTYFTRHNKLVSILTELEFPFH